MARKPPRQPRSRSNAQPPARAGASKNARPTKKREESPLTTDKEIAPDTFRVAPKGEKNVTGRWPVMLETTGWADYELLDMGDGEKLERYGPHVIRRPEAQAMGARRLAATHWEQADATFTGDIEEEGPGRWRFKRELPETWQMRVGAARFNGRFMSFRHVGVFPEQIAHWEWTEARIREASRREASRPPKVLNLFGYTGLASLLAAHAGAEVTHVDASKKAIGWARENQALSGMDDLPIRWICDDAMKFIAREARRGNTYDGIVLDPPKYGRGPKGEVWDLFRDLPAMLDLVRSVMAKEASFVILSIYAIRASFLSNHELMMDVMHDLPGTVESGELVIRETGIGERALSTSLFSRWSAE
ncbi:23S rRNA (cytosine1962-C5)-methyltransferase [Breoghania corrubedonensis]|uniref:23S rRNA (Cytosine1962-C5)-methyltransferase n=1 Tax=Breoghania corrubedonensis TaxID=665038 RepID=A0A2T5VFJ9_9HYPH|nr:23S rRNA (cytosine1962-C5)-methyltransferase [Breoghania corrubedonensis]